MHSIRIFREGTIEYALWSVHSRPFENLSSTMLRIRREDALRRTDDKSSPALIANLGHAVILKEAIAVDHRIQLNVN